MIGSAERNVLPGPKPLLPQEEAASAPDSQLFHILVPSVCCFSGEGRDGVHLLRPRPVPSSYSVGVGMVDR